MGKHWRRHDQERSSVNGAYEKASSLLAEKTALEEQLTAVLGRMFGHRKGDPDSVDVAERFALEQDIAAIDQHVTRIKQEKPEVAALLQHDEIQERLHEHHNGGFMQFVSRRKLVNRLLKGLVSTKPAVLMLGESGVGKTAVARELGKAIGVDVIYSLPPGDTSEPVQRLLATKGWEGNKDVYRFGSLLQAMTGYENSDDMRNGRKRHAGNIFLMMNLTNARTTSRRSFSSSWPLPNPGRRWMFPALLYASWYSHNLPILPRAIRRAIVTSETRLRWKPIVKCRTSCFWTIWNRHPSSRNCTKRWSPPSSMRKRDVCE